ncbi:MAG: YEATS-associated helix-containing protein, partial [Pseudomonadota bacterium]
MDPQKPLALTDTGTTDSHLLLILGVMIAAGILGGIANYFLSERDGPAPARSATRYALLGVVAALTVPLFLNMISSHLIEATRLKSSDLFVFAGFCLLYVVVSRRFFENIVVQLARQVEAVRQDVHKLKEARELAPAISVESESAEPAAPVMDLSRNAVSYGDIELLRAIGEGNAIYGALSGLAAKTTLPRDQVNPRLAALKAMGLIESRIDDKNVLRWHLSGKGRALLDNVLATASEERRETN